MARQESGVATEDSSQEGAGAGANRELTPNDAYIAEHCRWVPLAERRHRPRIESGRCLTEYDPITGEIIGDGYIHYDEDDDE